MITPNQAWDIILNQARPLRAARKPLHEAFGHCLAENVVADRDMPPANRSAVDGYAVRSSDLAGGPRSLHLTGEVAAGKPAGTTVRPSTCVHVLTGANIPPGADAVVMVEQTEESAGAVIFHGSVEAAYNIRRRGEEARKGAVLLRKGTILGPVQIGLCAAVGKAEPKVFSFPRVAVLSTGEELQGVECSVRAHGIRDSNGPALCAAIRSWGNAHVSHEVVTDNIKTLARKVAKAAKTHDVVVLTEGVSVGKYDFVPHSLTRLGAMIRFHGVAMKPGKPILYATLRGNRHIFGLPGNPLSAMTGFYEFVLPALRRLSGLPKKECRPSLRVPSENPARLKGGRVEFMLARLVWTKQGPSAVLMKSRGSADLVAGARADGVVVIPPNVQEVRSGSLVDFRPWRASLLWKANRHDQFR